MLKISMGIKKGIKIEKIDLVSIRHSKYFCK